MECAYTRGVAAFSNHKSEPRANARYLFDETINMYTVAAINCKDIYSGEVLFCDYGNKYQLEGDLLGKHDTLAELKPP